MLANVPPPLPKSGGLDGELYSFDKDGSAFEIAPAIEDAGDAELLELADGFVLRCAASRNVSIFGKDQKNKMIVTHNACVQKMIATPDRRTLITFTGVDDGDSMTYIDVSAINSGMLGVAPYKGKHSESLLDLPKFYPLKVTKASFALQLTFLFITIFQMLAFGVHGVPQVPALTQPAHFLEKAQMLGLDPKYFHHADDVLFCGGEFTIVLSPHTMNEKSV